MESKQPFSFLLIQPSTFTTFKERFKEFPIDVDYIQKNWWQRKNCYSEKNEGRHLGNHYGTHGLLNKKTEFKDLGLLIINEDKNLVWPQRKIARTKSQC